MDEISVSYSYDVCNQLLRVEQVHLGNLNYLFHQRCPAKQKIRGVAADNVCKPIRLRLMINIPCYRCLFPNFVFLQSFVFLFLQLLSTASAPYSLSLPALLRLTVCHCSKVGVAK